MQHVLQEWSDEEFDAIKSISAAIAYAFSHGSKVLMCGNGGSAADAQHFTAELVCSYSKKIQRRGFPAIALTTDTSVITAYSNDFDFEGIFARQIEALGNRGDVLIVFSTSGNSANCLNAVSEAKKIGLQTVSFTSQNSKLLDASDFSFAVKSNQTPIIQQCHQVAYHIVSEIVELLVTNSDFESEDSLQ